MATAILRAAVIFDTTGTLHQPVRQREFAHTTAKISSCQAKKVIHEVSSQHYDSNTYG